MPNSIQKDFFTFPPSTELLFKRVQKPHLKPSKRLKPINLPKISFDRKFKSKDGVTPRTKLAIDIQLKSTLLQNSQKYVEHWREKKYSDEMFFVRKLESKIYIHSSDFDETYDVKVCPFSKTISKNCKTFIKQCWKNYENEVLARKHVKDFFTPIRLKLRRKVWMSPNTIHGKKGLDEPKYHSWEEVNVHGATSNTEFLFEKVVLPEIQFDKQDSTFPDSTELLMPRNWNRIWKRVNLFCTKRDIFWTCHSFTKSIEKVIYAFYWTNSKLNK